MDEYGKFDTDHTFIAIFVIFGVFIVMIVCLLRAFLRFFQDAGYRRPAVHNHNDIEREIGSKNGCILPKQSRVPIIIRTSNQTLNSNKPTPPVNYFVQRQNGDHVDSSRISTDLDPRATETLLRHTESVPTNRPPSYQEAMASSTNELHNLLPPLK